MRAFLAFLVLVLAAASAVAYLSFFVVHQNEQAIVLEFGRPVVVIEEPGLHWKLPFVQTVQNFDKRILVVDTQRRGDINSKPVTLVDKKQLMVDCFALFRITNPLKFYQRLRDVDRAVDQLKGMLDSSLQLVLGSATLEDVVKDKREKLMQDIKLRVNRQVEDLGVEIVDVRIKRTDLPTAIGEAVYQRMRTERESKAQQARSEGEQMKRTIEADAKKQATVIRAEAQRQAEIMRGTGDGERNKIFADAFNHDPDFFAFYRSMQAYEKSMKAGDTRMLLSPDSEFFRYFNDPNGKGTASPQPARP